ncbi:elongation factor P--(R)-beta-lysine ligase [Aliiglaciecola sp. SL4]|uniref:elongation factor P--(R)-beta-lysine ligase n=1 Tax=Aliiglaciecola sp. SL4 TaxID=3239806 RepID=UPI00355B461D
MNSSVNWRPTATIQTLKKRAEINTQIREFFAHRNVLEVETPVLAHASVTDIHLQGFCTQFNSPLKPETESLFLQTSPEFAMKRLLCAGSGSIFQLCKSFRNEESGKHHNPEFTMLEWYRVDFNSSQLIDEIDELLQKILKTDPLDRHTYQQAFLTYCDIDPLNCTLKDLKRKAEYFGFANIAQHETSKDVLLQLLCSQVVEPKIGRVKPVAITDFPASQAALARIKQDDPRVAERFEIYFKGLELANGYYELSDVKEQLSRFKNDNQVRQQSGLTEIGLDEHFMAAMENGLPDCSGVALGVDRLVMIACEVQNIDQVMSFSIDNA